MPTTIKPYRTISENIASLQERGLTTDPAEATQWLTSVGYYRLSGYWYPIRQDVTQNRRAGRIKRDDFKPGYTFHNVVQLYEFDRKLRTLIHDGIERVEVALRNALVETFRDALALYNNELFVNLTPVQHYHEILAPTVRKIDRSKEPFVAHNITQYGTQLPMWVAVETLDFSDLSKIYMKLGSEQQREVARLLGIDLPTDETVGRGRSQRRRVRNVGIEAAFGRWIQQLALLRNKCAHHARVWNTRQNPASGLILHHLEGLETLPAESRGVYGSLLVMLKILERVSPGTRWGDKIATLVQESLDTNPMMDLEAMEFPCTWYAEITRPLRRR